MKSYTNIEQSKKLAEILPLESADMVYYGIHQGIDGSYHLSGMNTEDDIVSIFKDGCEKVFDITDCDIQSLLPCWSLASLLEQIPYKLRDDDGNLMYLQINKEDSGYQLAYMDPYGDFENTETDKYEHFVDACYEMILKLKENNLL